ncbi:MAG: hypothetical protein PVSMB10_09170 [Pseudarthrobacter sp.]
MRSEDTAGASDDEGQELAHPAVPASKVVPADVSVVVYFALYAAVGGLPDFWRHAFLPSFGHTQNNKQP